MRTHAHSDQALARHLGEATCAVVRAQHRRNRVRNLAVAVRYLEPLLIPAAAGVWLYVAFSVAVQL